MDVSIGAGTSIDDENKFICGTWTAEAEYRDDNYKRSLEIGSNALITPGHYFDIAGLLQIGDGTWIAGNGSQFWTHGAGEEDRDIEIGKDCYLGSAVRFCPGTGIGDRVIVGMGSVVTKKHQVDYAFIAGVPARVIKKKHDWKKFKRV